MRKICRSRTLALVAGGLAMGAITVIQVSGMEAGGRTAAAAGRKPTKPIRLTLHGSTPSMAWSADSRRLAANSGFDYYGHSRQLRLYSTKLGIFVVDVKTGKVTRATSKQGYHPFWHKKKVVGWGHSPYEKGTAGLYLATLGRRIKVRRIGRFKGVYHTQAATRGRVLMYSGWPEYKKWVYVNPRTGKMKKAKALKRRRRRKPPARPPTKGSYTSTSSWTIPAGLAAKDQCKQQVGKISIQVDLHAGLRLTTTSQTLLVTRSHYIYSGYSIRRCRVASPRCGPVRACLSPNGKFLAYFTHTTKRGQYQLNIMPVPR